MAPAVGSGARLGTHRKSAVFASRAPVKRSSGRLSSTNSTGSNSSLLNVPGIGKRTRDRLQSASVDSVTKLCDLYVEEHGRKKGELVNYLKVNQFMSVVQTLGISARWRNTIADWVHDETGLGGSKQITFCVEGNIGAGKTTWLDMVQANTGEDHELIEVVPEPVHMWQNSPQGHNLLQLFYEDPEKYAFAFQQFVLVTRMQQEENSRASKAPLRLLERSVFCDRMVFVKAVHKMKQLTPVELEVYDSWFNPIVQMRPQLIPDGFVYLKTNADTCARRIEMRNRVEEASIPSAYLETLQGLHDDWLIDSGNSVVRDQSSIAIPPESIVLGGMQHQTTNRLLPASGMNGASFRLEDPSRHGRDIIGGGLDGLKIPQLPSMLQGDVVLLDRTRLKQASSVDASSHLHLVPALHVDCVDDVELDDPDVVSHRAKVMHAFQEWVQQYQTANKSLLESARRPSECIPRSSGLHLAGDLPSGSIEALARMQSMRRPEALV